jgi:hypothetical protein
MKNDRIRKLLQTALPPVKADAAPSRDLWPAMQQRLRAQPTAQTNLNGAWLIGVWLDGVLAVGLVAFAAFLPASIPLLLYCL